MECWLEPLVKVTEIPPPPPPEPEPEDKEKDPYAPPKAWKRKVWTLFEIAMIDEEGKIVYDVGDVDKLMIAFKDAAARGGKLTMKFRPEPKDENKFRSYATVGDPTAKKNKQPAPPSNPAASAIVERE